MIKSFIKKADIVLFIFFLVFGLGGFFLLTSASKAGSMVTISAEGKTIAQYPLNGKSRTYEYKADNGSYNIIIIENGQVKMKDADCEGKDCLKFGSISREGQVIICAPHRLVVRITGEGGVDAVSY